MESSAYRKNLTQWGVVHQFDERKEWSRHTDANFNTGFRLFYQSETLYEKMMGKKILNVGKSNSEGCNEVWK